MKNILSVRQFTRSELHVLFGLTQEMCTIVESRGRCTLLEGKLLVNIFYEPSTRTCGSFEAAMLRLGGQVMNVTPANSSILKGETLPDTVRTLESYADVMVLRHPSKGSVQEAAKYVKLPLINAGDGTGEHPTQAFLDLYTIREELGSVNGLTITLVGDLKNGRTVHSLVRLLSLYNVHLIYVSPPSLRMPTEIIEEISRSGIIQEEYQQLEDVIAISDVLYVTRVQKERFNSEEEYLKVHDTYCINPSLLMKAKQSMILMHPLPRVNEIEPSVDYDQRAAYFRQTRYGLYVRMALLCLIFGKV